MIFLYILLALLVIVFLILFISLRITVKYGKETYLKIGALFFDFNLTKSDTKKRKHKRKKSPKKQSKKTTENKKSIISEFTEGLEISDFLQLLRRLIIHLVDSSSGHVRVRIKKLEIIVADKEPDAAALIFGGVNTVVSGILEYLELKTRLFPLHKSRIYVKCDFEKEHTEAEIELWTKIRIIHLVKFALKFFFDFMRIKESKNNTSLKGNK